MSGATQTSTAPTPGRGGKPEEKPGGGKAEKGRQGRKPSGKPTASPAGGKPPAPLPAEAPDRRRRLPDANASSKIDGINWKRGARAASREHLRGSHPQRRRAEAIIDLNLDDYAGALRQLRTTPNTSAPRVIGAVARHDRARVTTSSPPTTCPDRKRSSTTSRRSAAACWSSSAGTPSFPSVPGG